MGYYIVGSIIGLKKIIARFRYIWKRAIRDAQINAGARAREREKEDREKEEEARRLDAKERRREEKVISAA